MSLNLDQLSMVNARASIQSAYGALNGIQDLHPVLQVMACTVLFYETCQALQLDPSEMLDKARRVHSDAQATYSLELSALHNYLTKELNK